MTIAPAYISQPASVAMHRLLDGRGDAKDLATYRAWITWCRLNGDDATTLKSAIEAADTFAYRLGIT